MAKDTVDTRVVRMEFDNKQFEKNIKQTSKSLDKFKQDLDFKGVGDSLDKVKVKFSALQVAATTFVATLTNKLINLGIIFTKSLSVDNIASGWAKFGDKTVSVATMMAQKIRIAGKEITDLAEKTRIVNEQLELLTWFSDETSYSFTDMVNNIGKFTAAGQDLDASVKAMEGIATWAALAGQNSMTASRAMYQLAQAMGKGKIQRIDWMSIQNANMDTEEFRETILATAVALGQLTKEGDNYITKTGKKFKQSQFADYLSEGWFTSDVLIKGLEKYSAAIEEIFEISIREGLTASEVIEKYGDQLDAFGVKAFKAAQEARTFVDVINSVKDAVSSKWMQTFEKIFGSQEEAVKLWTELANELYDVFAESGNFRNNILSVWKSLGGRDDIFGEHGSSNQGAFWNLYDAFVAVRDLIKKAWRTVFPLSRMESVSDQVDDIGRKLKDLTRRIKEFTANLKISEGFGMRLAKTFQILFGALKVGLVILKATRYVLDPIIELTKQLSNQILDQIIYSTNKAIKTGSKFESFVVKIRDSIVKLIDALSIPDVLDETFAFVNDTFKLLEDLHPIESATRFIKDFAEAFENAGGTTENFRKIIRSVLSLMQLVRKTVISIVSVFATNVLPILDDVIDVITKIAGFIAGTAVKIISIIADIITDINKAFQGSFSSDFTKELFDILDELGNIARATSPLLNALTKTILKFVEVVLLIPKMIDDITISLTGRGIVDNLVKLFEAISDTISDFVTGVRKGTETGTFKGLFDTFLMLLDGIKEFVKGIISVAQLLLTVIGSALKKIGLVLQYISNIFIKIFQGRASELQAGEKAVLVLIAIGGILAVIAIQIYNIYWLFKAVSKPISVLVDSITGVLDSLSFRIKAGIIESFVNSIFKVALSLAILSALDVGKLWASIGAIATLALIFGGLLFAISRLNKQTVKANKEFKTFKEGFLSLFNRSDKNEGMYAVITAMRTIGNLMIKLAVAALIFDKVSWEGLWKALTTFGILLTGLGIFYVLIQKFSKEQKKGSEKIDQLDKTNESFVKSLAGIAIFMIAFKALAKTMAQFESISWESIWKVLTVMGIMMGLITGFVAVANTSARKAKNPDKASDIITSMVLAVIGIAGAILVLSNLDAGKVWASIGAISAIIGVITLATLALTRTGKTVSKAGSEKTMKAMKGLVLSLAALSIVLSLMTIADPGKILLSVLSLSLILGALVGSVLLLTKIKSTIGKAGFEKTMKALIALVATTAVLTAALKVLASSNPVGMVVAAGSIALLLGALVSSVLLLNKFGSNNITGTFVGLSVGLVVMSAALIVFTKAVSLMEEVGWDNVFLGLLAVAGGIVVLGVAAIVLKNVIPAILAISAAMLIMGVALLAAGLGLQAIVAGIMMLNNDFGPALTNLGNLISTVVSSIIIGINEALPSVIASLAPIATALIDTLIQLAPHIFELVKTIIEGVLNLINEEGGKIVETLIGLLDKTLDSINKHMESISKSLVGMLGKLISAVADQATEIGNDLMRALLSLLQVITQNAGPLVKGIIDLLIEIVVALFTNIGPLLDVVLDYVFDFIAKLITKLAGKIVLLAGTIAKVMLILLAATIRIVIASLGALSKLFITFVSAILLILVHTFIGLTSALLEIFKVIVKESLKVLVEAIIWAQDLFVAIGKMLMMLIVRGIITTLLAASGWLLDIIDTLFGTNLREKLTAVADNIADEARDLVNGIEAGTHKVENAIRNASDNINGVVSMTTNMANEAVVSGIGAIGEAVSDSASQLSGVINELGLDMGESLVDGIGSQDNMDSAYQTGKDMAGSNAEGFADGAEINSPSKVFSRFGNFLMKGLALGIQNGSSETENAMEEVISDSLQLATDILNSQDGDDYTIKVGMDISSVEAQTSKIQDLMSGVNNPNITASGRNAGYNARTLDKNNLKGSETVNNDNSTTVTNYNTFNIESNDPKQTADEIDKVLKEQNTRYKLAHGT